MPLPMLAIVLLGAACVGAASDSPAVAVWGSFIDPKLHPQAARFPTPHPNYASFGNITRFAALRGIPVSSNGSWIPQTTLRATLEQYTRGGHAMGDIIWPMYPFLGADQTAVQQTVALLADMDLFVADVWGFVPGSGPGIIRDASKDPWQQYTPPQEALDALASGLGDRWLGMDVGEQDGRYIGRYASQLYPRNQGPREQLANFNRHFTAMQDQLGNRVEALASLSFPHYLVRSGVYTVAGAETAQALMCAQLFYAFLRGAGKMYGVLWFGNVSVYGRFGYRKPAASSMTTRIPAEVVRSTAHAMEVAEQVAAKAEAKVLGPKGKRRGVALAGHGAAGRNATRGPARPARLSSIPPQCKDIPPADAPPLKLACTNQGEGGPTCGTSYNLMKRLMWSQYMYNAAYLSIENSQFLPNGDVSPIGLIQSGLRNFTRAHGSVGVHVAPTAILVPFESGWEPPRNLYSGALYRVWGNLPYSAGDYMTDSVMRAAYPGYQDSSYFHNERGFQTATPYGDTVDILLSDAPSWVLNRYSTIIVAGDWSRRAADRYETKTKLEAFNGTLVVPGEAAFALGGIAGVNALVTEMGTCRTMSAGTSVSVANLWEHSGTNTTVTEPRPFSACQLSYPPDAAVVAATTGATPVPLAVAAKGIQGNTVIVLATPAGIATTSAGTPVGGIDHSLDTPYPLLQHAGALINQVLNATVLFDVQTASELGAAVAEGAGGLASVVTRKGPGEYYLLLCNPSLLPQGFTLSSRIGPMAATEVSIPQGEKGTVGYLPDGLADCPIGTSTSTVIAGGDTRLFHLHVTTDPSRVRVLPKVTPPRVPVGVGCRVAAPGTEGRLVDAIGRRPSFFQRFDTLLIDYRHYLDSSEEALAAEHRWLALQHVRVVVDLTSGLNLYPNLRLLNNSAGPYAASQAALKRLWTTMQAVGVTDAVVSWHIWPENNDNSNQQDAFGLAFKAMLADTKAAGVTLHLRQSPKNFALDSLQGTLTWMHDQGLVAAGMRLAPSLGMILSEGGSANWTAAVPYVDLVFVSAPAEDITGQVYSTASPVSTGSQAPGTGKALLRAACAAAAAAGRPCPSFTDPPTGSGRRGAAHASGSASGSADAGSRGNAGIVLLLDAVYADPTELGCSANADRPPSVYRDVQWLRAALAGP